MIPKQVSVAVPGFIPTTCSQSAWCPIPVPRENKSLDRQTEQRKSPSPMAKLESWTNFLETQHQSPEIFLNLDTQVEFKINF